MLRLPPFEYHTPRTVHEAVARLAAEGDQAAAVAGGTDLFPNMKRRQQLPRHVVSLKGIPELTGITRDAQGGVSIGACSTLAEVARNSTIVEYFPALAQALSGIASPPLRNMGTLGGNLCLDTRCNYYDQSYEWRRAIGFCLKRDGDTCWVAPGSRICLAVNSSDSAPILCALGARVRLESAAGAREISLDDLYRRDGIAYLKKLPGEIVSHILLAPPSGWIANYVKLARRGAIDFPVLGVAAAIRRSANGEIAEARIYLNAVASAPVRATEAEQSLLGKPLTPDTIRPAARLAAAVAKPMDNTDLNFTWRKSVTHVYVERALAPLKAED